MTCSTRELISETPSLQHRMQIKAIILRVKGHTSSINKVSNKRTQTYSNHRIPDSSSIYLRTCSDANWARISSTTLTTPQNWSRRWDCLTFLSWDVRKSTSKKSKQQKPHNCTNFTKFRTPSLPNPSARF